MLIPVGFSCFLYAGVSASLTEKAYENGRNAVTQIASVTDEQLDTIFSVANAICISSDIRKLKYVSLPFNAEKYYEVHQRAKSLSNYTAYHSLVEQIYLHCKNLDSILDSSHIYTRTNQYSRIIRTQFGLDDERFESLMAAQHQREIIVVDGGRKVLLLHTIPAVIGGSSPSPVTLILVLRLQSMEGMLASAGETWQGGAFVLAPQAQMIETGAPYEPRDYLTQKQLDVKTDKNTVVTVVPSAVSDFEYGLSVPRSVLLSDVYDSSLLFLYFALCTLVLGGGIAYMLARHNYRPIHQLKQSADIDARDRNELGTLARRINDMRASYDTMRREVERLRLIENEKILDALLTGELDLLEKDQLRQLSAGFDGNLFVVAVLETEGGEEDAAGLSVAAKRLTQLFTEAAKDACQCILRPSGARIAVILCYPNGASLYDAQLYAKRLTASVLEAMADTIALYAYIGGTHENLSGVARSYDEALRAKEYADFVSETGKQVVLYDQTMYSSDISWQEYDIVDAERRFAALMLEGDYLASERLLREMMSYYTGHEGLSLYVMRCRMFGLMNMMLNVLHEVEPDVNQAFNAKDQPLQELLTVRTMQELEDVSFRILDRLHSRHLATQNQLSTKIGRVEHYIAANYFDLNLSVQQVADKFNLSLPYLSREFKNSKGIGVLSYINKFRVDKAKEIMESDGAATIADIAGRVGYNSSQTLIRIFKRYEGVTPGQFRAALEGRDAPEG